MEDTTSPARSSGDDDPQQRGDPPDPPFASIPVGSSSSRTSSFSGSTPPSSPHGHAAGGGHAAGAAGAAAAGTDEAAAGKATMPKMKKRSRKQMETQLMGMEREIERLLLLWQHEFELVERVAALSTPSPSSSSSLRGTPMQLTPRDDQEETTNGSSITRVSFSSSSSSAGATSLAQDSGSGAPLPSRDGDVEEELRRIDMEMEQLLRRRRAVESLRRRNAAIADGSESEAGGAERKDPDSEADSSRASSTDFTPRSSIDNGDETGSEGGSFTKRRGTSGIKPTRRQRNPTISLGSERVVTTASGAMSGAMPSASTAGDGSLSSSPSDQPAEEPKYRRSRSFVLPAAVKGGDLIQALKVMAEEEGIELADVEPRRSAAPVRSTSMGSGDSDTMKILSNARRQRSSSASGAALGSTLMSSSSSSPRSPSTLAVSSTSTSTSPSSSSSSASRRSLFLTFRRKGKEHNGVQSTREDGTDRLMTLFSKDDHDKDTEKTSPEFTGRSGSKSMRMHVGPWLKDELEKGAREEKRKSKNGKTKHSSLGKEGTNQEKMGDVIVHKEAALKAYQNMEDARWEGYAKDAADMLDDADSGFYHLNVYFLASNREQARQFYACLDRFLQQFDTVAQADKANGVLGPLWVTAPKVVHRSNGEVERDLG